MDTLNAKAALSYSDDKTAIYIKFYDILGNEDLYIYLQFTDKRAINFSHEDEEKIIKTFENIVELLDKRNEIREKLHLASNVFYGIFIDNKELVERSHYCNELFQLLAECDDQLNTLQYKLFPYLINLYNYEHSSNKWKFALEEYSYKNDDELLDIITRIGISDDHFRFIKNNLISNRENKEDSKDE